MSASAQTHVLGGFLAKWAREQPQRAFLRTPGGRELGYGALLEQSARFAGALRARGVTPGERVVARVETSPEAVLLYLACLRLGAVFVPANPAGTRAEFEYLLRDADARLTVVSPAQRDVLACDRRGQRGNCGLETLGSAGEGSLAELVQRSAPAALDEPPAPGSLAALVYTSGTTGRPKGAMLTQANLAANAVALARAWRFSAQDQLLHALPLFHVHGLFVALNTVLVAGAGLVLLPKFDAATVLQHLPQATCSWGCPRTTRACCRRPGLDRHAAARVRLFVSGSAPLLPQTLERFRERTGQTILERYGMTETLMNTSNPYAGARIPGSVGLPLEGVAVRVTERAGGAPVSTGTIGMLEVRGPNVFAGYWRDAHKTRDAFSADGWFRTGDLGRIDADGLRVDRRPRHGPRDQRRVQRVSEGGRSGAGRRARRRRERRVRRPARGLRRGRDGGRRAQARGHAVGGAASRARAGAPVRLQGAQAHPLRARSCRATRWARCARTHCVPATRRSTLRAEPGPPGIERDVPLGIHRPE